MMSRKATHNGVLSTTNAEGETSSGSEFGEVLGSYFSAMLQNGHEDGISIASSVSPLWQGLGNLSQVALLNIYWGR